MRAAAMQARAPAARGMGPAAAPRRVAVAPSRPGRAARGVAVARGGSPFGQTWLGRAAAERAGVRRIRAPAPRRRALGRGPLGARRRARPRLAHPLRTPPPGRRSRRRQDAGRPRRRPRARARAAAAAAGRVALGSLPVPRRAAPAARDARAVVAPPRPAVQARPLRARRARPARARLCAGGPRHGGADDRGAGRRRKVRVCRRGGRLHDDKPSRVRPRT
jgi:hypothetical protein